METRPIFQACPTAFAETSMAPNQRKILETSKEMSHSSTYVTALQPSSLCIVVPHFLHFLELG